MTLKQKLIIPLVLLLIFAILVFSNFFYVSSKTQRLQSLQIVLKEAQYKIQKVYTDFLKYRLSLEYQENLEKSSSEVLNFLESISKKFPEILKVRELYNEWYANSIVGENHYYLQETDTLMKEISEVIDTLDKEITVKTSKLLLSQKLFFVVMTILSAVVFIWYLGIVIPKHILRPLTKASDTLEKIGEGDFSVEVSYESNDELGKVFENIDKMKLNISHLFSHFLEKANDVKNSNKIIEEVIEKLSSDELDRNIEDFTAYLEETSAEMEIIVENLSNFASSIEKIVQSTSQISELNANIVKLSEKIEEISDKISVLAITATIETNRTHTEKESLVRISEMIMELSKDVKKATKNSREILLSSEETIESTLRISNDILERLTNVRGSLDIIQDILSQSVDGVTKIANLSHKNRENIESVMISLKVSQEVISKLTTEIDTFLKTIKLASRGEDDEI